jgi:hypothetical protein
MKLGLRSSMQSMVFRLIPFACDGTHAKTPKMAGPAEVAQINVISGLRVKHFKIAHWDHYGFSPIVKTADGR